MNATGDASGGLVEMTFHASPGDQRKFVYVVDWVSLITDLASANGPAFVRIDHHHELPNVTLDMARFIPAAVTNTRGSNEMADMSQLGPWLRAFPIWWRQNLEVATDIQRSIVIAGFDVNVDTIVYQFRAAGRYYDSRILASRDFWKLFPSEGYAG